ncbi:hypothetical protein K431DRAFT_98738 [Polychaeton citri CBS 116435]|uniref:Uncharacterized protein n=1 Tax=Polychaeton citri CBS 116435 TaxID=1314669 RepID=A0A9P4QEY1_9PEZI|nr:hypothetical protein K431DRAFT_98738 [Polychaeton citri CBS 116435]
MVNWRISKCVTLQRRLMARSWITIGRDAKGIRNLNLSLSMSHAPPQYRMLIRGALLLYWTTISAGPGLQRLNCTGLFYTYAIFFAYRRTVFVDLLRDLVSKYSNDASELKLLPCLPGHVRSDEPELAYTCSHGCTLHMVNVVRFLLMVSS